MTVQTRPLWPALVASIRTRLEAGATVRVAGDTARLDLPGRGPAWVSIEHYEAARASLESREREGRRA